eukprot:7385754-Alexandrium_andersonii.AAC.1
MALIQALHNLPKLRFGVAEVGLAISQCSKNWVGCPNRRHIHPRRPALCELDPRTSEALDNWVQPLDEIAYVPLEPKPGQGHAEPQRALEPEMAPEEFILKGPALMYRRGAQRR